MCSLDAHDNDLHELHELHHFHFPHHFDAPSVRLGIWSLRRELPRRNPLLVQQNQFRVWMSYEHPVPGRNLRRSAILRRMSELSGRLHMYATLCGFVPRRHRLLVHGPIVWQRLLVPSRW